MHSLQPQQNAQLRPRGHDENILEEAYRGRYARQRLLNFWPESSCGYHAIKRFVCIIQVQRHSFLTCVFISAAMLTNSYARQAAGNLLVEVRSDSGPVEQAEISVGAQVVLTDARGEATLELPPGEVELMIARYGFKSRTVRASVC